MTGLIGIYRPGTTLLHRLPAGPKLGLVALWSVVVVGTKGWRAGLICLGVALVIAAWARLDARRTLRSLRGLLIMLAIVSAFQVWQRGWEIAVSVSGDLLALFLIGLVFTTTTPVDGVLTAIERGLRPLRPLGVQPERVALAFSLMLAALPNLIGIAGETRAAAKARGLERDPRALLTPFAIRAVSHALETGDALHARGLGDD